MELTLEFLKRVLEYFPETGVFRWKNIRESTPFQQQMNTRLASNNTSGYKNVFWNPRYKKWEVKGSAYGNRLYLGRYKTKEEGNEVYTKWARENHGEFYRE